MPENHQIPLYTDKESFLKEEITPKIMSFTSLKEKLHFLIDHDYIDKTLIQKYPASPQNSDTDFSFITTLLMESINFIFNSRAF